MTSSVPSLITTKPFATWMTSSSTLPPSQTIGESPERYSRPSVPTNYSSDWRNVSLNVKRWITFGSSLKRPHSNGPCYSPRSQRLASASEGKGCPVLHRGCELLPKLHPQLLQDCLPPPCTHP